MPITVACGRCGARQRVPGATIPPSKTLSCTRCGHLLEVPGAYQVPRKRARQAGTICPVCAPGSFMRLQLSGTIDLCPRCGKGYDDAPCDGPEVESEPDVATEAEPADPMAMPITAPTTATAAPLPETASIIGDGTIPPSKPSWATGVALVLAAFALLSAYLAPLVVFAKAVAALGMVAGVVGILNSARPAKSRVLVSWAATIFCALEVFLAGTSRPHDSSVVAKVGSTEEHLLNISAAYGEVSRDLGRAPRSAQELLPRLAGFIAMDERQLVAPDLTSFVIIPGVAAKDRLPSNGPPIVAYEPAENGRRCFAVDALRGLYQLTEQELQRLGLVLKDNPKRKGPR
jgi:hypothetical protein